MELDLCPVRKINREPDALVITWQDGAQRVFSHRWLRDNAPENRHPLTGERQADFAGTEDIPSPRSFAVEYDETLVVAWAGAWEVSRYALTDLRYGMDIAESVELALAAD